MTGNRIREIRRQKGMTLHELAARIKPEPTTAQTVGRLETGTRTLSLTWLNKIAEALGCDTSDLLETPPHQVIPIAGDLFNDGLVQQARKDVNDRLEFRLNGTLPLGLRMHLSSGEYRQGDLLILDRYEGRDIDRGLNYDCLVETQDGDMLFGKLIKGRKAGRHTLIPLTQDKDIYYDLRLAWAAKAITLIRNL